MNRTINLSLIIILFLLFASIFTLFSQTISGKIIQPDQTPAEYVNIGILEKQIGTVSDLNGNFSIYIPKENIHDTLFFSRIGLERKGFKIEDLQKMEKVEIVLHESKIALKEFQVIPKTFVKKTIGVSTKNKSVGIGYSNYHLGYELGLRINIKKPSFIEKVNINVASCTYDSIFLRLNIYKIKGNDEMENILRDPIYISLPKEALSKTISIDLKSQYLYIEDDVMISIEYVRDLGEGNLYFCASLISQATYFRETSHGKWNKIPAPIGASISVEVETEK